MDDAPLLQWDLGFHFILNLPIDVPFIHVSLERLDVLAHDDLAGIDMFTFDFKCFSFNLHVPFLHMLGDFLLLRHFINKLLS